MARRVSDKAKAIDDAGGPPAVPEAQGGQRQIGVVLWARVSEEVEQTLERGTTRMRPQDWKSGDRLWVVEVIAPAACPGLRAGGGHDAMVADLKAKVFPTEALKVLALVRSAVPSCRLRACF